MGQMEQAVKATSGAYCSKRRKKGKMLNKRKATTVFFHIILGRQVRMGQWLMGKGCPDAKKKNITFQK